MKKNASTSKKLALKVETIRMLTNSELNLVVGGNMAHTHTSGASKQTAVGQPTC